MDFATAVKTVVVEKYAKFTGRSSVPEYWWFFLFNLILTVIFNVIIYVVPALWFVQSIIGLALLLPGIGVGVRRLHDTGRSGWWLLIAFTIIGIIPLIYWLIQPSQPEANQYGAPPVA